MVTTTVERLGTITNLVHGFIYFSTEASNRYGALGLTGRQQYFAGRAAPMGPVGPGLVVATFYNFNPAVVHEALPEAWAVAAPAAVQAARFHAAADVLHGVCADIEPDITARATAIAQRMVDEVGDEGKPLAASNRSVALPDDPAVRLWQLVTIIREWRGDTHVAALGAAAVSGIEALVLHAATGQVPASVLQSTRAWTDQDWQGAVEALAARDLVDAHGVFTPVGQAFRADIEAATNTASQPLVDAVGDDQASLLCDLLKPIRSGLIRSGVFAKPLGGAR